MAWVYKKYTDNKILYQLEAQAKNRRIGLWADENPIAPWDWRRGKRLTNLKDKAKSIINL